MAKLKLKYLINHFIDQLPRHISVTDFVRVLEEKHNINRATFYRDRAITIKDDNSIPSDRLDIYAALFGVSSDALKNYQVKIRPIADKTLRDKVKSITGLKTK